MSAADAARLGVLRIHSTQGQAVAAGLTVHLDNERSDELTLEVVAAECNEGRAQCPPFTINRMADAGEVRPVWRVTSEVPMDSAVADLWVKLSGPHNSQMRSYRILLDPPVELPPRPAPAPLLAIKEQQQEQAVAAPITGRESAMGEVSVAGVAERAQVGTGGMSGGDARAPDEVSALIARWAQAWMHKRVEEYLGYYAQDFLPADGATWEDWAAQRRRRIRAAEDLDVSTARLRVTQQVGERVTVEFRQHYRSRLLRSVTVKRLVLENRGGKWLILEEQVQQ